MTSTPSLLLLAFLDFEVEASPILSSEQRHTAGRHGVYYKPIDIIQVRFINLTPGRDAWIRQGSRHPWRFQPFLQKKLQISVVASWSGRAYFSSVPA
jgi:hypothetical protein